MREEWVGGWWEVVRLGGCVFACVRALRSHLVVEEELGEQAQALAIDFCGAAVDLVEGELGRLRQVQCQARGREAWCGRAVDLQPGWAALLGSVEGREVLDVTA